MEYHQTSDAPSCTCTLLNTQKYNYNVYWYSKPKHFSPQNLDNNYVCNICLVLHGQTTTLAQNTIQRWIWQPVTGQNPNKYTICLTISKNSLPPNINILYTKNHYDNSNLNIGPYTYDILWVFMTCTWWLWVCTNMKENTLRWLILSNCC